FHVVTHRIHSVVRLVTMQRPVASGVSLEVIGPDRANRDVNGCLLPTSGFRYPSAVRARDCKMVPVHVNWMVCHGEIGDPNAHTISLAYRHVIDAGEHPRVESPQIEVEHLCDLGHVTAGVDTEGTEHEDEGAIDAHKVGIARMDYDHAQHPHRHLHHLVGMRVIHEGSALLQLELVDEGLAGSDVRLGQATDAIHAGWHQHAVPVHRCVLWKVVGDKDADLIALHSLDGRAGRLAIVSPQVRLHARRKFTHHRL